MEAVEEEVGAIAVVARRRGGGSRAALEEEIQWSNSRRLWPPSHTIECRWWKLHASLDFTFDS